MDSYFAILEDDAERIEAMGSVASAILPSLTPIFFENAFDIIEWLKQHLHEVSLISLDHDLPLRNFGGMSIDCGDGRLVADYLAQIEPTCAVVVHSSNTDCAAGMFFTLERAGWPTRRVVPFDGVGWIERDWKAELKKLVDAGWLK